MATTPGYAESLASGVVEIYTNAENKLLELIASHVKEGMEVPDRLQRKLNEVRKFRAQAASILATAQTAAAKEIRSGIATAVQYGAASAAAELASSVVRSFPSTVTVLANTAANSIRESHFQLLPKAEDIYTRIIRSVINAPLLGLETPQEAADKALKKFAQEGITVFSRGGRLWQLSSYVEMAIRTSMMNATLQGHAQQMQREGFDLVLVSAHAQECNLCRPYEGQVLSLEGMKGRVHFQGHIINVLDTLANAKRKGLFHPNCRHSFTAYTYGAGREFGETADPEGDKDRQKLRYLERQVRAWKRVQATAITPEAAKEAGLKAREWQSRIREHVAETSAKRQPDRERITGTFR